MSPTSGPEPPSRPDGSSGPYDAFISYRRKDARAVASWLRRRLEHARIPPDVLARLSDEARDLHRRRPTVFMDTFDSEGDHVIVVAADARRSTVFRVDLARGSVETMTSWKGHDVSSASIARTGHVALGDTNGDVAVVDPSSRTVTEKAARLFGAPAQVGFDIATDVLAVAAQGQFALYDLRSDGVLIHERVASVPVGFQPTSLEFAPPGSVLVVGDQRGVLSFWNVASLTEITRVRAHDGPVLAVRVSPDGSRMASLAPGSLRLGGGFIPASVALAERMTRSAWTEATRVRSTRLGSRTPPRGGQPSRGNQSLTLPPRSSGASLLAMVSDPCVPQAGGSGSVGRGPSSCRPH